MGLESQTRFIVTQLCIECQSASLFGEIKRIVPLSRVASTTAGVRKPIGYLFIAGMMVVAGPVLAIAARQNREAVEVMAVCLVLAVVFAIVYFLSKVIVLEVSSNAGLEISLRFKPSILEGVPVDVSKALATVEAIRDLLVGRELTTGVSPAWPQSGTRPPVGPRPPVDTQPHPQFAASSSVPPVPTQSMRSAVGVRGIPGASPDETTARNALRNAVQLYKAGQTAAGIEALRDVVSRFAGTQAADTARGHLKNLTK